MSDTHNVPAGSPFADEGSAWTYAEWMEVRGRLLQEHDQLKADSIIQIGNLRDECEQLKVVVDGIKHLAGIQDVDAWLGINDEVKDLRAEVERLKKEVPTADAVIWRESCNQWRAVADQAVKVLKEVSWHKTVTPDLFRAFGTYHKKEQEEVLSAYQKLKGAK